MDTHIRDRTAAAVTVAMTTRDDAGTPGPTPRGADAHPAAPPAGGPRRWPGGPDLVVVAGAVPDWVRRWAARSGRNVRRCPSEDARRCATRGDTLVVPGCGLMSESGPRVLAAVGDPAADRAVVAEALDAAVHLEGTLHVVHAVPMSFSERSVGLPEALDRGRELLAEVDRWLRAAEAGVPVSTGLVRAWPHEVVGEQVEADLVAVGGPRDGAGDAWGRVVGSAVHHSPGPVVVVARPAAGPPPVPDLREPFARPRSRKRNRSRAAGSARRATRTDGPS